MKAIVYERYGSPEVLELKEVPKPTPKDNEVLIKVHASSINSWDWDLLNGKPFIVRLVYGAIQKPKYKILGADVSGIVEAIGKDVTEFQSGDEVFGDLSACGWGGFSEYVCVPEKALALKPAGLTFEEVAAVPQAGLMALQGLRDKRQIQSGQSVLINGAGGGVGTFAVQIAKSIGAEVTGVDKAIKLDMLLSIGADHVIDYMKEDFTINGKGYDLILDVVAGHSIYDYKRALSPKGIYIMVGGSTPHILQAVFLGPWISKTGSKRMSILAHKPNKDMALMKELFESGKVKPVIDRSYPLNQVAEAFRYFGEGNVQGKVVITI